MAASLCAGGEDMKLTGQHQSTSLPRVTAGAHVPALSWTSSLNFECYRRYKHDEVAFAHTESYLTEGDL